MSGVPEFNGSGEAEVVPGFQLVAEIQKFQEWWDAEYPTDGYDFVAAKFFIGALQFIEEETERCAIRVGRKYLYRILSGELQNVSYSKAEAILMALSKEYKLKTGEITVIPNPNWSFEKWVSYMDKRGCF